MIVQQDIASQAAATMRHLLQLASDAPGCLLRFNELDEARKAVGVATAKLAARRDAFATRETEGAKLARLTAALAERRDSVEQAEAMLAGAKETCAQREREWTGLGLPKDAPANMEEGEE